MLQGLYRAFVEKDAMLAEINPLMLTGDGRVLALDAKINFDNNALYPPSRDRRSCATSTRKIRPRSRRRSSI